MASAVDEALLDDGDALLAADPSGRLLALATAGAQVREVMARSEEAGVRRVANGDRPRSVVVASLGGACPGGGRAGSARSTWWSRCRCPVAPPARWPWPLRPDVGARGC